MLSIQSTFHEKFCFSSIISELIYIPHEDISIRAGPSVPSLVIVILPIVCHALFILEGMLICARVITDANPKTIVKNNRIRFLIEIFFDDNLWTLNMLDAFKIVKFLVYT
ncbi:TPA: hypothetical protein DCZ39_02215 [Patescibacteria group bacterium]|nr:hypothetical protein [Candidatus Gracilibacteria bacterium]